MRIVPRRRRRGNEEAFAREMAALRPEFSLTETLFSEVGVRAAIVRARQRAGLTQRQLARRMETSLSEIARLEGGGCSPSVATLQRLAEATGARLVVRLE